MSVVASRRSFLAGAAAVAVAGFDPVRRTWVTSAQAAPGTIAIPHLDGTLSLDAAAREGAADDFGHIVHRTPIAVLRPGSVNDIVKVVRYARDHGLKVAPRGQGHDMFGQAQTQGGIVIDSSTLATIHSIGPGGADVDAGVVWRSIYEATTAQGLTPPTQTDYIDLSVGGTLSGAGVNGAAYLNGAQIDNVLEVQVVTGNGELRTASLTENRVLFESVLGGLGQFGFIVRAKIKLVAAPALVRFYTMAYADLASFVADFTALAKDGRFDNLGGQFAPNPDGTFTPVLLAGKYYTPPNTPDDATLLEGLSFIPPSLSSADLPYIVFIERFDPLFTQLENSPAWAQAHPWFDVFIPASKAEAYLANALAGITPDNLGTGGVVLLYPFRRNTITRPFFRVPHEEIFFLLDIARYVPRDTPLLDQTIAINRQLYDEARTIDGTRYCIGAIPFSQEDWVRHFGDRWLEFVGAKLLFDPFNVMTPGQGIFRY